MLPAKVGGVKNSKLGEFCLSGGELLFHTLPEMLEICYHEMRVHNLNNLKCLKMPKVPIQAKVRWRLRVFTILYRTVPSLL